jgi:hypothetical protein
MAVALPLSACTGIVKVSDMDAGPDATDVGGDGSTAARDGRTLGDGGGAETDRPADGQSSAGDTGSKESGSSQDATGSDTAVADGPVCACPLPSLPANGLLYNGGTPAGTCPTSFTYDYVSNSWFSYSDGTVNGGTFIHTADFGGCDGADSCAFHTSGAGYTGFGAGVGFTLNDNVPFDASSFSGLDVYLRGTTTGTRGLDFSQANNTVHVKLVTGGSDGGDPLEGDDYGAYCPIQQDGGTCYTLCHIPFVGVTRDGYVNAGVTVFEPQALVKIQFESTAYIPAPDSGIAATPVGFDVWIDNVAFY